MTEAETIELFFAIPEQYRKDAQWVECECIECLMVRAIGNALAEQTDREFMEAGR